MPPVSVSVDGDNTILTYALGTPSVSGDVSTYTTALGVLVDNGDGTIKFTPGAGVFQSLGLDENGDPETETIEFHLSQFLHYSKLIYLDLSGTSLNI